MLYNLVAIKRLVTKFKKTLDPAFLKSAGEEAEFTGIFSDSNISEVFIIINDLKDKISSRGENVGERMLGQWKRALQSNTDLLLTGFVLGMVDEKVFPELFEGHELLTVEYTPGKKIPKKRPRTKKVKVGITEEEDIEDEEVSIDLEEIEEKEKSLPPVMETRKTSGEIDYSNVQNILGRIYEELTSVFKFPDEITAKVFLSSCLFTNAKMILKGVPGTGKTTLIEAITLLLANPYKDVTDIKDWEAFRNRLEIKDILGIAMHNPDKMPPEVYYHTDIRLDTGEFDPETISEDDLRSLFKKISKDKSKIVKGGVFEKFQSSKYHFYPIARRIINSFIKFHNEGNRMNKTMASATLGLMSENKMEFLGTTLYAPKKNLTFLDYNPHVDSEEGKELDRAFLDRIDVGMYFPRPTFEKAKGLLDIIVSKNLSVSKQILADLKHGTVKKFSKDELMDIWEMTDAVEISDEATIWGLILIKMLSMSFYRYSETYEGPDIFLEIEGTSSHKYVDTSVLSYNDRVVTVQDNQGMTPDTGDYIQFINSIRRPLGFRALVSLLKLARSYVFLEHVIDGTLTDSRGALDKSSLIVNEDTLIKLLPYVSDHRINLGAGQSIEKSFFNFKQALIYKIIPSYITEENKNLWTSYIVATREIGKMCKRTGVTDRDEIFRKFDEGIATASGLSVTEVRSSLEQDEMLYEIRKLVLYYADAV